MNVKENLLAMATSEVRQNYHPDCEEAVNDQIRLELNSVYAYLSMASHCQRSDVALDGFFEYFNKALQKKLHHVQTLTDYQLKRGGEVVYHDIKKPAKDVWDSG